MGKTNKRHSRRFGKQGNTPRRTPFWERAACSACQQPVIKTEEKLEGGRLRGALLADQPDQLGTLVRDANGYVVRDYERTEIGTHWKWHNCPVRNA
jgi:hypothetical protein